MKNKSILKQHTELKQKICDYIAEMIGCRGAIKLDWTFQSVSVPLICEGYGGDSCNVSEVFVEDGCVYIKINNLEYPDEIEETTLVEESMDVVCQICEFVEGKTE